MKMMGGGVAAASLSSVLAAETTASAPGAPRPNIVLILADDLGFSDIGCYGSEIHTPNLDKLAGEGLRFTQFYCAARCCPSRASILTGLYPHQAGMGNMVSKPDDPRPPGPYQGYLNDRCVTVAEMLKQAGYRTYMSGKWHVGEAPEHWPRKRGFDRYFGLISGACSYWELLQEERHKRVMALDDDPFEPEPGDFYMTDAFTDHALQFLQEHGDNPAPFFLYLPFTAPHWPLHAWPEDIEKYRGRYDCGWDSIREERYERLKSLGIIDPKWALSPRDDEVPPWSEVDNKEDWALRMNVYAAMVDRMDQGIGRVLDALNEMGAEENTLVMFLSDNGGCAESVVRRNLNTPGTKPGERGSFVAYQRPWANASNSPFRLFKKWIHEGGIATPLVARWPRVIRQQGALTHQVGHINDFMSTCLDVAGLTYPESFEGRTVTPTEGKSLFPVFRGETRAPHEILFWEHIGNRGVRQGKWKLVAEKAGGWELYDLEADRTELHNLADEFPEKAKELNQRYDDWAKRVGAV